MEKQTGKPTAFGKKTSGSTKTIAPSFVGWTWIWEDMDNTNIYRFLDYFELKVKKYAFTGIAATLMQDAVTFNSGLFIPVAEKGESTNQKFAPLCSVTNTAACSFVQDEYEDIYYCFD